MIENKKVYYDLGKTLSYNCLFNFILGARGQGKTFGWKKFVISKFIKNKEQFAYIRRYKTELKNIKKFFDDIKDYFPEHTFKVKGNDFLIDNEVAGTVMTLSTAIVQKSTPYPKVTNICFDEFLIETGVYHYLKDEVINFLELYSTISRDRDCRVCFFTNSTSLYNPYFIYFNLQIPYNTEVYRGNDILVHIVDATEYSKEMQEKTRFGKIIAGTTYGDYNLNNKFLLDNKTFIEKKTSYAYNACTLIYKDMYIGYWIDKRNGLCYLSNDYDKYNVTVYALTTTDHKPNTLLLKGVKKPFISKHIVNAYQNGCLRFENQKVKSAFNEFIRLL